MAAVPLAAFLLETTARAPAVGSLTWIGAFVAAWRRHHPIGGWLFFFLWQVVVGVCYSTWSNWATLAPRAWKDQTKYLAYIVSTAPEIAILWALAAAGYMLLRTYDWKFVVVIRYLLIVLAVFGAIGVGIYAIYFPGHVMGEAGSLIFPVFFSIYFFVSARVRSVFLDRVWDQRAIASAE